VVLQPDRCVCGKASRLCCERAAVVDVDVDVEEIRAQTNNCLYARS